MHGQWPGTSFLGYFSLFLLLAVTVDFFGLQPYHGTFSQTTRQLGRTRGLYVGIGEMESKHFSKRVICSLTDYYR